MIYDLICSLCGTQLDFYEGTDREGDLVICVSPCPNCNEVVSHERIKEEDRTD